MWSGYCPFSWGLGARRCANSALPSPIMAANFLTKRNGVAQDWLAPDRRLPRGAARRSPLGRRFETAYEQTHCRSSVRSALSLAAGACDFAPVVPNRMWPHPQRDRGMAGRQSGHGTRKVTGCLVCRAALPRWKGVFSPAGRGQSLPCHGVAEGGCPRRAP